VADREDLSGRVEPGCTYAFLEHESADGTEVAQAAWEQGLLVVPGRFFDDTDSFRVGACRDTETVRAGLDRLGEVLDALDE
jgi:aspartate/methionine/tyrosine aminotransferase